MMRERQRRNVVTSWVATASPFFKIDTKSHGGVESRDRVLPKPCQGCRRGIVSVKLLNVVAIVVIVAVVVAVVAVAGAAVAGATAAKIIATRNADKTDDG